MRETENGLARFFLWLSAVEDGAGPEVQGQVSSSCIRLQDDHLHGAAEAGHGARRQSKHAGSVHDHGLSLAGTGVTKHGRNGGGCTIRRAGHDVRHILRHLEDRRAFRQVTVCGHTTDQRTPGHDFLVAEFYQALAFWPQSTLAEETFAATPHHRPGYTVAQCQWPATKVVHSGRPHGDNVGHHLVPQHAGHRRVTSAVEGMQVAATDRRAAHTHDCFTPLGLRNG